MARKKGCKVVICKCGKYVVGMPDSRKKCPKCGKTVRMPSKKKTTKSKAKPKKK